MVLHRAAILLISHVTPIVILRFDGPVAPKGLQQPFAIALAIVDSCCAGDRVAKLFGCFDSLGRWDDLTFNDKDLRSGMEAGGFRIGGVRP